MKTPGPEDLSNLSPFELKNFLVDAANHDGHKVLNAGRGNPNFLATVPRNGFFQFGLFAMEEAERSFSYMSEGVGGFPMKEGIEARFEIFVNEHKDVPGVKFIRNAVSYVRDQLGINAADFIYEMSEAILGCSYPVPDRMLKLSERIVAEYIRKEMIGAVPFSGRFDMFAVEGGTAAISYLFTTLKENFLLGPGDSIALGTPIFTPYIEIPGLSDFDLTEVFIDADPAIGWQIRKEELEKLRDPKIKAFFLVNPSNPPSVKLSNESLQLIAEVVKDRPDLIIITDDVYGTFADDFASIFAYCPQNTILVYSFSKYFGATGWRLGLIATHEKTVLDPLIDRLPENKRNELTKRYQSINTNPASMKFIDRMVAESRAVALNHTAGLSTPQQVLMVFFSLFSLMDEQECYKRAMKRVIHRRKKALYRDIPVKPPEGPNDVDYYHVLDMETIGKQVYEQSFIDWLLKRLKPNEFLFSLADRSGVVLLPGSGFGGPEHPSARVSLANLNDVQYRQISSALKDLMEAYHKEFEESEKEKKQG